jgi:hypothetical protein
MARAASLLALVVAALAQPLAARQVVDASAAQDVSVTVYRDPSRGVGEEMDRGWPRGFAMVSETRTVTLPPGESTIRFTGVAEGMVAVSAIVTGLPGGTIEKNRNADLLSPAALVDGTLGNRVRITRTNPASGAQRSEDAIIRTRADGGLVLQTSAGFEAVRCSGLPEKLTFAGVPGGLSADPVFSIDTRDPNGGTHQVTLTYLAWGFDWQAHYVARLGEAKRGGRQDLRLMSWLTILNDNGQSFDNAQLLAVAGTLNVTSDYQQLSDPPTARPLQLTCYPIGSTARGSPVPDYDRGPPAPPPAPMAGYAEMDDIVVTAQRRSAKLMDTVMAAPAMEAAEEQLGDLKLYRVPERVSVNAKGLKQIAFLNKQDIDAKLIYESGCDPWNYGNGEQPMALVLETVNDEEHGLGAALPTGGITVFEGSSYGDLLVAEDSLRDYAEGQDVEIALGESSQVFASCELAGEDDFGADRAKWRSMKVSVSNANRHAVKLRIAVGSPTYLDIRRQRGMRIKDGELVLEAELAANSEKVFSWKLRPVDRD